MGEARAATASDKPSQWAMRLEGLGSVVVGALRRGEVLNVRVMRTEPHQAAAPAPTPGPPPRPPPRPPPHRPPPRSARTRAAPAPAAPSRPAAPTGGPPPKKAVQIFPGAQHPRAPDGARAAPARRRARGRGAAPGPRLVVRPESASNLTMLLEDARSVGASDLHVIAGRPPLFRVVGELLPQGEPLPPETVEEMLLPHVPARLRPVLDREGSCDFSLDLGESGRFRVNVSRQRTGYKGCFRLIPREIPTLESLGLPVDIAKATHHHQGLIVVTGPSGHGKTSTLAAIVDIINRETTHHVITVEDPVEYVHPRKKALMSQREVGTHTRTFASALKGSLREDPDVIVVGELRDTETVRMALAASETGHLLICTMNTPSAAKTIDRLIDLFPPADQAAGAHDARQRPAPHRQPAAGAERGPAEAGGRRRAAPGLGGAGQPHPRQQDVPDSLACSSAASRSASSASTTRSPSWCAPGRRRWRSPRATPRTPTSWRPW